MSRRQRATGSPVNEIGVDEEGEPGVESRPDDERVAAPIDIDRTDRLLIGTTGGRGKIAEVVVVRNWAMAPEPIGIGTRWACSAWIAESRAAAGMLSSFVGRG